MFIDVHHITVMSIAARKKFEGIKVDDQNP